MINSERAKTLSTRRTNLADYFIEKEAFNEKRDSLTFIDKPSKLKI
jgi:hypothetical protein